jgi:hypothetical protein
VVWDHLESPGAECPVREGHCEEMPAVGRLLDVGAALPGQLLSCLASMVVLAVAAAHRAVVRLQSVVVRDHVAAEAVSPPVSALAVDRRVTSPEVLGTSSHLVLSILPKISGMGHMDPGLREEAPHPGIYLPTAYE